MRDIEGEIGGRRTTRQPGQIRKEAATPIFRFRVIVQSHFSSFKTASNCDFSLVVKLS